jgi:hypothetical protein
MVDIIIGAIQPAGPPVTKPNPPGGTFEAELLNVREPRQRIQPPKEGERRRQFRQDPVNGRVLTLLIPNGQQLPKDLDGKRYKVMLRFVKK